MEGHSLICKYSHCHAAIQATLDVIRKDPDAREDGVIDIVRILYDYHQSDFFEVLAAGFHAMGGDVQTDVRSIESLAEVAAKDALLDFFRHLRILITSPLSVDQIHDIFIGSCQVSVNSLTLLQAVSSTVDRLAKRGADTLLEVSRTTPTMGPSGVALHMRGLGKNVWQQLGGADEYLKSVRGEWD